MSEAAFRGVFPYLVSPIRDSGQVDSAEGVEDARRAPAAIGALP